MTNTDLDSLQHALGDQYAVEREIGRGGMGAVFLARDVRLHRPVAIKVLPPELSSHPDLRERFLRETRVAASFSHPNIVPVHGIEERDGLLAFVMGFVDGETLGAKVRRSGPISVLEAVRVLQEMAWALSYAHGRGVVHRDVKPDNILVERASGRALITDFGIARSAGAMPVGEGLTRVGEIVGTPEFMSPEQASADTVDGRSDIYSLGVVGYYMLSGKLPFDSASPTALLAMHLTQAPPSLALLRPDLPAEMIEAVERCLAKSPDDRWASGEALASALDVLRRAAPEVPPAMRGFLQRFGSTVFAMFALGLALRVVVQSKAGNPHNQDWWLAAAVIVAAFWGLGVQAVSRIRMLVRQGFRYRDVEAAVASIRAEDAAARDAIRASPDEMRRRSRRIRVAWGSLAWAPIAILLVRTSMRQPLVGRPGQFLVSGPGIIIAISAAVAFGLGVTLLASDPLKPNPLAVVQAAFWRSTLGRTIFRLSAWRMKGADDTRGADTGARVTRGGPRTVLIALPAALRRDLRGIDARLTDMERELDVLGAREAQLSSAMLDASMPTPTGGDSTRRDAVVAELGEHMTAARQQRAAVVTRLDEVRLQLVRLKAGIGSSDAVLAALES
ncbi:MAG: serine/threonine-protein kinase [Gemmatimonadales bacterium]